MDNQLQPPPIKQKRVFKTPIIVPISVIMVVLIYAGYIFFFLTGKDTGLFTYIKHISFEVFLLCEIGIISLTLFNKAKLDNFLKVYPAIMNVNALEALKPVARTNMYSALFNLFFIGLGSLAAVITILNHGPLKALIVVVLSIIATILMKRYTRSEELVKQIHCPDSTLEKELDSILQSWLHKAFPNF